MREFFHELRRRNIFRVAGVYSVIAWLLVQVSATLESAVGLPTWFDGFVVAILLIGFPIAMILAWAFEMTPEGMRLNANTADGATIAPKPAGKLDYVIIGGLALVGVMIVADRMMPEKGAMAARDDLPESTAGEVAAASIAVLPFADLSPDGDQEYFSDGIAEEILNVLVRVDGLNVASRTSAFRFKGADKSIPTIASELNVAHILEGSVRKAGDRIRITAQLISAESDVHLWSETYDRKLTVENIFEIQDEIAKEIVSALRGAMAVESIDAALSGKTKTENLDAYDLYLHARNLQGYDGPEQVLKKIDLLEQAVTAAPEFGEAWARLAFNYSILPGWDNAYSTEEWQPKALDAADRATVFTPDSADVHIFRAAVHANDFDWARVDEDYSRARELAHAGDPYLSYQRGVQELEKGYIARAVELLEFAVKTDPAPARPYNFYGLALAAAGRLGEAERAFVNAYERGYTGQTEAPLMEIYQLTGREQEFRFLLSQYYSREQYAPLAQELIRVRLAPNSQRASEIDRFWRVAAELGFQREELISRVDNPGGIDLVDAAAVGATEALLRPRPAIYLAWVWGPEYADARKTDAFKQHIRNSNLPAYWRKHGWPDKCRPVGNVDFECD